MQGIGYQTGEWKDFHTALGGPERSSAILLTSALVYAIRSCWSARATASVRLVAPSLDRTLLT